MQKFRSCWNSVGMRRFRLVLGQCRYAEIQIIVGTVKVCGDSDYCWDSVGMRRFRLLLGQCRYVEIQIIVGTVYSLKKL